MFLEFRIYLVIILVGIGLYFTQRLIVSYRQEKGNTDFESIKNNDGEFKRRKDDSDADFIDENGNHIYYERSLIEKALFHKRNPQIPYSELRSFKRLFRRTKKYNNQSN